MLIFAVHRKMPSFSAEKLKTNLRLAASRIKLQTQKKQNSVANEKVLVGRLLQDNKEDSARIKVPLSVPPRLRAHPICLHTLPFRPVG